VHEVRHITFDQPKPWLTEQMTDIGRGTGEEIVQTGNANAAVQQFFAQV
jgi:hypothetical protein